MNQQLARKIILTYYSDGKISNYSQEDIHHIVGIRNKVFFEKGDFVTALEEIQKYLKK